MREPSRRWALGLALVALGFAWTLAAPRVADAALFACSAFSPPSPVQCLIDAMTVANGNGEANTIVLDGSTFTLTAAHNTIDGANGLPSVTGHITIQGNGATIQRDAAAAEKFRVFHVDHNGTLELIDVTVKNGRPPDFQRFGSCGGGIFSLGALILTQVTVRDNRAGDSVLWDECCGFGGMGGGVYTAGTATITRSTIHDNRAGDGFGPRTYGGDGGGIWNQTVILGRDEPGGPVVFGTPGILSVSESTIRNNRAGDGSTTEPGVEGGGGGGIATFQGQVTISRTAIHNNVAGLGLIAGNGGGLKVILRARVDIDNTTFFGNVAGGFLDLSVGIGGMGGAISVPEIESVVNITNSLFSQNLPGFLSDIPTPLDGRGGALWVNARDHADGTQNVVTIKNSIFDQNFGFSPINGTFMGEECHPAGNFNGDIVDGGYNIETQASCGFSAANHSLSSTAARLGPSLLNLGGPTQTLPVCTGVGAPLLLCPGASPAVNAIPAGVNGCGTAPVDRDQRGVTRPQGAGCEIGPVEVTALGFPTLVYHGNGNTGGFVPVDPTIYAEGATAVVQGNTRGLVKTGFGFTGWNTAADGSGTAHAAGSGIVVGAGGADLFAQWTPGFTVTYSGNGNTGGTVPVDGTIYQPGMTVIGAANAGNLVKTGFAFAGWNTAADGSGTGVAPGGTFLMGAANVTLFARWTAFVKVFYDGNGATGGTVPVDGNQYLPGDPVAVLGNTGGLVKTGFGFGGWQTEVPGAPILGPGDAFEIGSANVTLRAKWAPFAHNVLYDGNGHTGGSVPVDGTGYPPDTMVIIQGPGTMVKAGFVFAGWNTAADGSGFSLEPTAGLRMGEADVTLFAQWAVPHGVTYHANGATGGSVPVDANAYAPGATVTVLGNTGTLVRTGFTFAGWNTAANGSGAPYPGGATFVIGGTNVVLFAQWTALPTFTVTYSANGATGGSVPVDPNTYVIGATVTVLGNPGNLVRTGFTFAGWNTAANGSGTGYAGGSTFLIGAGHVTLFAQWTTLPTFTVTYNANAATGGSVPVDSNAYVAGATVTVLGNPGNLVRTGFTFAGWNTAANGTGTGYAGGSTFPIGAGHVTLFAQWTTQPTFTVTYDGNGHSGGSVPLDGNAYVAGSLVTVLGNTGNLVRIGQIFAGWNTAPDGSGTSYAGGATFTIGAANVTLFARWTVVVVNFVDVPPADPFYRWVQAVAVAGITGGCLANPLMFCPDALVTRGQLAVLLLRAIHGAAYDPPAATGTRFADVPSGHPLVEWIEDFANHGLTGGCLTGPPRYCPNGGVSRAHVAVLLLRALLGPGYDPPPATGRFVDVPADHPLIEWIEDFARRGITRGCDTTRFCPDTLVTREQLAVFLVRTFGLPLF